MNPERLKYTKDHEWLGLEGDTGTIGITDFAQKELGDVVFVELPDVGRKVSQGEEFGTIESVKAVSELYSPVSGEVIEVNGKLRDNPDLVNKDPYGEGWVMKLRVSKAGEAEDLMNAASYQQLIGSDGH